MRRYLDTALRYRWVILLVLALTWGAGAAMAYHEYTTSFEADATIWTDRQSVQFTATSPQDPGFSSLVSPATQQAGVLGQLLQTRTFLQDVVQRAGVSQPPNVDDRTFYQDISKRFRVDVLGSNLVRLYYRATDPRTGSRMVLAALAARTERLAETRTAATAAAATFYRSQLDAAQARVAEAQQQLDTFERTHMQPFSASEQYQERQLRTTLEDAKARVDDLKSKIDGSATLPTVLELADTLDFQIIDKPLEEVRPSGGTRPALTIGGSGLAAGIALVGLLIVVGTLLDPARSRRNAAGSTGPGEEETAPQVATGTVGANARARSEPVAT